MDKGQIRTFVYYELLLGNDTGTGVANICRACKEDAVSQRSLRRRFNRFESGDTSLKDREPNGRNCTVDDDEIRRCIKEKPEATTRELATTLGCSYSGPCDIHRLMDANKQSRVAVDLVTEDKTWVLYDNDARRAVWIPREEEPPTAPKADLLPLKILLCCWWAAKNCCTSSCSRKAGRSPPPSRPISSKNKPPPSEKSVPDRPRFIISTTPRAPTWGRRHSRNLAPSDYHLFRPLEHRLAGRKFINYDSLKSDLADFFESQPPEFWAKGVGDLLNRWVTVVNNCGDYIVE
ncbi:unnamed protein product [Caenorhabditis auriculariae]|uniref:Mos1 transposase HTH domain-containing protein n=1 Tax=Caenorhabditis auriculariae TaxID=2777116 RepID=A0A8S1HIR0_9PELO|nr:unnamed protein product [Caenorhabditis auriculariae]